MFSPLYVITHQEALAIINNTGSNSDILPTYEESEQVNMKPEELMKHAEYHNRKRLHSRDKTTEAKEAREVFKFAQLAMKKGSSIAIGYVGECFYHGIGVKQDRAKGIEYMKKAADLGEKRYLNELGYFYKTGVNEKDLTMKKNVNQAIEYYKASAKLGSPEAYYHLANLNKNKAESLELLRKGAELERNEQSEFGTFCLLELAERLLKESPPQRSEAIYCLRGVVRFSKYRDERDEAIEMLKKLKVPIEFPLDEEFVSISDEEISESKKAMERDHDEWMKKQL